MCISTISATADNRSYFGLRTGMCVPTLALWQGGSVGVRYAHGQNKIGHAVPTRAPQETMDLPGGGPGL